MNQEEMRAAELEADRLTAEHKAYCIAEAEACHLKFSRLAIDATHDAVKAQYLADYIATHEHEAEDVLNPEDAWAEYGNVHPGYPEPLTGEDALKAWNAMQSRWAYEKKAIRDAEELAAKMEADRLEAERLAEEARIEAERAQAEADAVEHLRLAAEFEAQEQARLEAERKEELEKLEIARGLDEAEALLVTGESEEVNAEEGHTSEKDEE